MKKINEHFTCINCGKEITQANKTCRNHCPFCFTSLHVDGSVPGDRESHCKSIMYPLQYEIRNGQMKILFQCSKCDKKHRNKIADDDEITSLDQVIKNCAHFF